MKLKSGAPLFTGLAFLIFLGGVYAMWSSLDEGVLAMRHVRVERAESPLWFWISWAVVGAGSAFFLFAGIMSVVRLVRGPRDDR